MRGDPQAAGDLEVVGHRGAERLEVRLAGQVGVKWFEAPRGAHEQPARVGGAVLLQRNLSPQELDSGALKLLEGAGLDGHQQSQGLVERAGVTLAFGRREQALGPAAGVGGQHCRTLQEGCGRGRTATSVRPGRGPLELLRDPLVEPGRRVGQVPCATVGVELWIGGFGQRPVDRLALGQGRRPVHGRAN